MPAAASNVSIPHDTTREPLVTQPHQLLVVDDDPDLCALVGKAAERAGWSATAVPDFFELQGKFRDDFAAIVLDLDLPQVDGIEVIRFLAAQSCSATIVVSSSLDQGLLQTAQALAKARGLTVGEVLKKPYKPKALVELLEELGRKLAEAEQPRKPRRSPGGPTVEEGELRAAIESGQIIPFYQPKVDFSTGEVVAVEALARWQHPGRGLISPGAFIPLAEKTGLIDALTESVVPQAFAQCGRWASAGRRVKLSVNLSAKSFSNLALPESLSSLARKYDVDHDQLVVEVTESALSDDPIAALDILTRLRMMGFGLSIDDFGTGFSNAQQLEQLPFSELKVDQSFVRGASTSRRARSILHNSIGLAHRLGLRSVAEGVETRREWDLVSGLSCDEAQGYFVSRPVSGDDLTQWFAQWKAPA